MTYERFAVIYDADGGLLGEAAYVARKLLKREGCAACDITHGLTGERDAWKRARQALPVPVDQLHRNELTNSQTDAAAGRYPCVLGRRAGEWELVLEPSALEALDGDPERLAAELKRRSAA